MATLSNSSLISPQEYLERERKAETKSEYLNGEVIAMSGAREAHVLIASNLGYEIKRQTQGKPCRVYGSDMRVRVNPKGSYLYAYPDLSVTCEKARFEDDEFDTLLNPLLLVEILSESTERRDRGVKSSLYRKLDSLKEYLLISQTSPHVERYSRQSNGEWLFTETDGLESSIQLASLPVTLTLSDIYELVEF